MQRLTLLTVAGALACGVSLVFAQTAAPQQQKNVKVANAAAKKPASSSRQQLKSEAAGLALAIDTTETINQNQLDIAARVLTGKADCEFDQTVDVQPHERQARKVVQGRLQERELHP